MYGVMPLSPRTLPLALASGFAVTLAVGAGLNRLSLSSSPASATVDAGCSVGAVGSADPRPDAGASACMDARSRTDGHTPSAPDRLLSAIEFVESRGRADAVGDGGRAVGILQIHACVIDDVNSLVLRRKAYTLADRTDPVKSREIFRLYLGYWCPNGTDEDKARSWNGGGPRGRFKESTKAYWCKVRKAMEEQQ